MTRPLCVVCQRECVPMADYEQPVCVHCDDYASTMLERIRHTTPPRVVGLPAGVHDLLRRLVHVLAEAMAA